MNTNFTNFQKAFIRTMSFVLPMYLYMSLLLWQRGAAHPFISRDPLALLVIFLFLLAMRYINYTHSKLSTITLALWIAYLVGGYFYLRTDVINFLEWQGYTNPVIVELAEDCGINYDLGFIVAAGHPWAKAPNGDPAFGETMACFDPIRFRWISSWIAGSDLPDYQR